MQRVVPWRTGTTTQWYPATELMFLVFGDGRPWPPWSRAARSRERRTPLFLSPVEAMLFWAAFAAGLTVPLICFLRWSARNAASTKSVYFGEDERPFRLKPNTD